VKPKSGKHVCDNWGDKTQYM